MAPHISLYITPNATFYIAINIAYNMATNICTYISTNISFNATFNISEYIATNTTLNISFDIAPHVCVDLKNPQLSINKPKSDQLIDFFDLRHCLLRQADCFTIAPIWTGSQITFSLDKF